MITSNNPYAAPRTRVADVRETQEYCELTPWTTQGRIGRLRFVAWLCALSLSAAVSSFIIIAILGDGSALGGILISMFGFFVLVFGICMQAKRLHDMNFSAWFILILLIPFIGSLLSIVTFFWPGSEDENDYGPPAPPDSTSVKVFSGLFIILIAITLLGIIASVVLGRAGA